MSDYNKSVRCPECGSKDVKITSIGKLGWYLTCLACGHEAQWENDLDSSLVRSAEDASHGE
jgi:transcription elongation factor Elf1